MFTRSPKATQASARRRDWDPNPEFWFLYMPSGMFYKGKEMKHRCAFLMLHSGHLKGNPSIPETQPTCLVLRISLSQSTEHLLVPRARPGLPEDVYYPNAEQALTGLCLRPTSLAARGFWMIVFSV